MTRPGQTLRKRKLPQKTWGQRYLAEHLLHPLRPRRIHSRSRLSPICSTTLQTHSHPFRQRRPSPPKCRKHQLMRQNHRPRHSPPNLNLRSFQPTATGIVSTATEPGHRPHPFLPHTPILFLDIANGDPLVPEQPTQSSAAASTSTTQYDVDDATPNSTAAAEKDTFRILA